MSCHCRLITTNRNTLYHYLSVNPMRKEKEQIIIVVCLNFVYDNKRIEFKKPCKN